MSRLAEGLDAEDDCVRRVAWFFVWCAFFFACGAFFACDVSIEWRASLRLLLTALVASVDRVAVLDGTGILADATRVTAVSDVVST